MHQISSQLGSSNSQQRVVTRPQLRAGGPANVQQHWEGSSCWGDAFWRGTGLVWGCTELHWRPGTELRWVLSVAFARVQAPAVRLCSASPRIFPNGLRGMLGSARSN